MVSLRPSIVEGDTKRLKALTLGGLASGHVSRVEEFGLFVDLSKTLRCSWLSDTSGPGLPTSSCQHRCQCMRITQS